MFKLWPAIIVLMLSVTSCSAQPELVQVECEAVPYTGPTIEYGKRTFKVRRVKYWSDGSTTYESMFEDRGVMVGEWQLVAVRDGLDPCP